MRGALHRGGGGVGVLVGTGRDLWGGGEQKGKVGKPGKKKGEGEGGSNRHIVNDYYGVGSGGTSWRWSKEG